MRYRELVTVQEQAQTRSAKAAVTRAWSDLFVDVPATIVPSALELRASEMNSIQDRFDIVLAGRLDVRPAMAVVAKDGRRFDVESVDYLLGGRQTRAIARRVSSPSVEVGS